MYDTDRRHSTENATCSEEKKLRDYPLLNQGLMIPALLSILMCIVGILFWWFKARAELITEMTEEESSALIRKKLGQMSAFELYTLLVEGNDVDETAFSDSMKLLPDKSGLLKIAEDIHAFDNYEAEKCVLMKLKLKDLVDELINCNKRDFNGDNREIVEKIEIALDGKDAISALVNFVMQHPNLRRSIVMHLRSKRRSSVFMSRSKGIQEFDDGDPGYSLYVTHEDDELATLVNDINGHADTVE